MVSPSSSTLMRTVPCIAGCDGPRLSSIVLVGRSWAMSAIGGAFATRGRSASQRGPGTQSGSFYDARMRRPGAWVFSRDAAEATRALEHVLELDAAQASALFPAGQLPVRGIGSGL